MIKIAELVEKLHYGPSNSRSKSRQPGLLKDSIQYFIRDHGSKYLVAKKWGDRSILTIKRSMSRMASDYLVEEGPRLWPNDEESPLYDHNLIWPQNEEAIKDLIADYFFAKSVIKHRNRKKTSLKQNAPNKEPEPHITSELAGRSLRSDQFSQIQEVIHDTTAAGPSTAVGDKSGTANGSDPCCSDIDEDTTLDDTLGPGPRDEVDNQRQQGILPMGSVAAEDTNITLTPKRTISNKLDRIGTKATPSSPENGRTGVEARPSITTPAERGELSSDDENGYPFDIVDNTSPRKTQTADVKGKGKEKEMPPPLPRNERSILTPAARLSIDVPSPTNVLSESAYRFRGPSEAATLSPITIGRRSPSARPRAPDALMTEAEQAETRASIETVEGQESSVTMSGNTAVLTSKSPSKAHIWYHAVQSRHPEENRKSWGPDRVKTLAELKRKLRMDFDHGNILGLECILKGPNITRTFEIDHNDDHQLQRVQDMLDNIISQTMKMNEESLIGTPVTFDIEVELFESER